MSWGFKIAGLMALGTVMLGTVVSARSPLEQMFWSGVTVLMFAAVIFLEFSRQ